jgi:vitamin K-dependent gamma-carboxylase
MTEPSGDRAVSRTGGTPPATPGLRGAWRQLDIASLAAFRVVFGLLIAGSSLRFLLNGWVDRFFVQPTYFFPYSGFEWVRVLPPAAMYAAFGLLVGAGLLVALGFFYRAAIVAVFVVFTYVELIDVTNYLNHYYLVSLEALILCVLPAHACWSLDARRRPELRRATIPAWMLWLLRFQVGLVYFYAALAKATSDWLLHAQPLNIWLTSRAEFPVLGALFDRWEVALAMGWAGFLHDLLIVPALLWRRTRTLAYGALVAFHTLTGLLFPIGMFPVIMVLSASVFLDPSWPRAVVRRVAGWVGRGSPLEPRPSASAPASSIPTAPRRRRLLALALGAWVALHVLVPLRTHLYGGDVLWHEQGMRWSWRVMVREKNGSVTYRVTTPNGQERVVPPSRYLTAHQEREMSGQPDLIVRLGQHLGEELEARYGGPVAVRVDALASLNGRPMQRLIDPDVDLMTIELGVARADWILPGPESAPARLQPVSRR